MPKKVVENIKTLSLPYFPVLAANNAQNVITKHFVNTALYLPAESVSLLMWLIYQSNADNSFKYEEKLVAKYSKSVKAAEKQYGSTGKIRVDFKVVRTIFKQLIETGYILPTDEQAVFIINPMLTYHPKYVTRKEYKLVCENQLEIYDRSVNLTTTRKELIDLMTTGIVKPFGVVNHDFILIHTIKYRQIINSKIAKKKK
jgi:hypothetical protein